MADCGTMVSMAKILVFHEGYGCDTGCCGHAVHVQGNDGQWVSKFEFDHPYAADGDDPRVFAEELIRKQCGDEHVADLDWANSVVIDGLEC